MSDNPYSSLKILHHSEQLTELRNGGHPKPVSIRFVLSDLCNQNCHFCTFRMENSFTNKLFSQKNRKGETTYNPARFIGREKALEIVNDAKEMGIKSIEFTGGGEPTVHPDHLEVFNSVLDSGINLGLITNGVLFRPGFVDTMMRATWVRFSVDAANKETYSQTRRVPLKTYDSVLKNIKKLVDRKKEVGSNLTIGMSFVVTDQNYGQIYQAVKIASEMGVDYLRIAYYRTDDGFVAGDYDRAVELINKSIEDFQRDDFAVLNQYTESSKNIDGRPDYDFCAYQHISTWIAADYNVYRCCVTSYDNQGLIGSIRNQSFKELWESKIKRDKFDNFNAKSCTHCIYNNKNKLLNYITKESPDHVNFV